MKPASRQTPRLLQARLRLPSTRLLMALCCLVLLVVIPRNRDTFASSSGAVTLGRTGQQRGQPAQQQEPEQQQQQCHVDTSGSVWEKYCQRLEQVCVDHSTFVLYNEKYQKHEDRRPAKLPVLEVDGRAWYSYPWRQGVNYSYPEKELMFNLAHKIVTGQSNLPRTKVQEFKRLLMEPLPVRAATNLEPTAYLRNPVFSSCTIPVVIYPKYAMNYVHAFEDGAGRVLGALLQTPWRQHVKLVVATPHGIAVSPHMADMLRPLTNMSVPSMAEFSNRDTLPSGELPDSYEGGRQHCFQQLFFCGNVSWPELNKEVYEAGQQIVRHILQQQGSVAAAPALEAAQQRSRPRSVGKVAVTFMKRGTSAQGVRQILNADELLQRCNTFQWEVAGEGRSVRAACVERPMPSLQAGVQAAQASDVMVGFHGANMANAWLMRRGSSVIEIMPYELPSNNAIGSINGRDLHSQVFWWFIRVCDPEHSQPSPLEILRKQKRWWKVNRSAKVPWQAVEKVLGYIVEVNGSKARYKEYREAGRHWVNIDPGGQLRHGTCYAALTPDEKAALARQRDDIEQI